MTTSAHLLLAQIEDVLDLAKIEAGRVSIERRAFEPSRLLPTTVKVILPQARYKGLAVNVDIAPDVSGWFLGDAHHLRQVVLNLLANAVKFTERGEISLRAYGPVRRCSKSFAGGSEGYWSRYSGREASSNFRTVHASRRFDHAFVWRNWLGDHDRASSDDANGWSDRTGEHRWSRLTVSGSSFHSNQPRSRDSTSPKNLPLVRVQQHAAHALAGGQPATVHKLRGARILVAEDNPTNQRVAQLILESGGHRVTIVENGEKALDALERGGFDVALFDLSMPLVSGVEALKLYRFTTPNPIPVLILSANVTTEAIDECHRAGAAEFMPKPLRASLLLDAIERHLSMDSDRPVVRPPVLTDDRPALTVVDVPPLDPAVLEDLARLSPDETFVERLLRGFKSDTERLSRQIIEALGQRRYELVKDAAHALKGGAASVGATQLTQFATRLEKLTHESLRLRAAQLTEELQGAVARTFLELEKHLEARRNSRARPARSSRFRSVFQSPEPMACSGKTLVARPADSSSLNRFWARTNRSIIRRSRSSSLRAASTHIVKMRIISSRVTASTSLRARSNARRPLPCLACFRM